ncbi:FtsH protease activity modulator HflK [Pseudooctadecabacter jejudonensis]|uniref:Protein HflK n=1 Tax=Pseudooctadecabacter jejudonensis TaxID=1391910 RepID=A0A1Y5RMX8_9RHOB|nr:FtsH protease activity modulator HflK [Pseudooctadecabacter jejudonensis]SLN20873.1 Modulator of FtsH protease HflK [Pseudooctadecabacter jejudonensis]
MAGNNGGPWGGGGNGGGDDDDRFRPQGGRDDGKRGQNEPQIPEFDEIVNKTKDQLRVLIGGGDGRRGMNGGGTGGGGGPQITRGMVGLGALAAVALWAFSSFYTVRPEQQSVELFLGEFSSIGQPGLNFAPWPFVTAEIVNVTQEQTIDVGVGRGAAADAGLMLTGDENIVDIDFQVVWNITEPERFLFNLADPAPTIAAVAESSMREIIAQSELAPILNRDRGAIADGVMDQLQATLDSYDAGVNIIRVNLQAVEPPSQTITVDDIDGNSRQTSPLAAFRDVQDAEQERDRLQNLADAYANRVTAQARGDAARVLEDAEAYRARVVNEAQGEASRFLAVLEEYQKAPEVTRQRLYLETVEAVFGSTDIILLDDNGQGGGGVVPYLPLNEVRRPATNTGGSN